MADICKGAMGGAYEFANIASANLRQKDDAWNPTIGGFCAGTMLGLRCKRSTVEGITARC